MAINNVWIIEGCISCGLCEDICPQVFKLKDIAVVNNVSFSDYTNKIKESAESCPVDVIKYSEPE